MRKSLLAVAGAAAMSLGVASARAQLLYSFEPGDSPNSKDGFGPNGLIPSSSTTGVTNGVGSLKLTTAAGGYTASYTQTDLPALLSNPGLTGFTADVTISANDPAYTGTYSLLGFGFYIENAGESEYGDQYISPESDWANIDLSPGTYSIYIPLNGNDPDTGLPTDYPDLLADGWSVSGFNIADQNSGAAETFYLDNIQGVVPEPASIGIGVASGLLMLARRRRKA